MASWRNSDYSSRAAFVDSAGHILTYGEFDNYVKALELFLHQKEIGAGKRIAFFMEKSFASVTIIRATHNLSASYIPVDVHLPTERIHQIIHDAQPHVILFDPQYYTPLPGQIGEPCPVTGMESVYFVVRSVPDFDEAIVTADQSRIAYILYTSGSTGGPKGVVVSHDAASSFIDWAVNTFRLNAGDQIASIAPFHFDLSVFDIFVSLQTGCTLHLFTSEEVKNVRFVAQEISKRKINIIYSTPSFFTSLLLYGKAEKHEWNSLSKVLFAGEVFPIQHLHALMHLWKQAKFFNLYGPTETNVCTWTEIRKDETRTSPYPIGIPCQGHEYEISAEGELIIGGPHVANGYLNQPDLTEAKFFSRNKKRWFRTGDIAEQDSNGQLIYKGRIDRMIKRRGFRIEPAEIEHAILRHHNIISCAVVDVPGIDETPLLVVFAIGNPVPDIMELKQFLLKHIPDYMLPDQVRAIDEIPITSTGKTDYIQLRKLI